MKSNLQSCFGVVGADEKTKMKKRYVSVINIHDAPQSHGTAPKSSLLNFHFYSLFGDRSEVTQGQ